MRADPSNLLSSLSSRDVTFFIPPYQRNYEWSTSTCKVFLTDLQKVAALNSAGTRAEHFFGSVVYVIEDAGFGVPSRFILTDGQQRITTSMLFLMALRDTISDEYLKETIQKSYLENERSGVKTDFKIKLKQVETDWEAYKLLALGEIVPQELKNSAVFQNYEFFRRSLDSIPEEERRGLLENGLAKFSIIAIQLEPDRNPWENPQEIFESMNSLGKPLSATGCKQTNTRATKWRGTITLKSCTALSRILCEVDRPRIYSRISSPFLCPTHKPVFWRKPACVRSTKL
jgi:uncharacterized protein with ParB-like and HNH nuclease domain